MFLYPCESSDTHAILLILILFFFFFPPLHFTFCWFEWFLLTHQLGRVNSMASSSRARSSSPFSHRKLSTTPYYSSASSSSSSFMNGRLMPRSCSSSASSFFNSGAGLGGRSTSPSRGRSDLNYYGARCPSPVEFGMEEEVIAEPLDSSRSRDSISVTIRFRPLR